MPPLRDRLLLLSPWAYDTSFKTNVVDGDIYGLWAHAARLGLDAMVVDGQHRVAAYPDLSDVVTAPGVGAVLAHLWTADNYGDVLRRQCERLADLRRVARVPVIAFGYLAVTAADDILASGAVDAVRLPHGYRVADDLAPSAEAVLADHAPATRLLEADMAGAASLRHLPPRAFAGIDPATIFSIRASRGCRARCSFCSYNADVGGGWHPRGIREVVDDIATVLDHADVRRIALSDADFGGSDLECRHRAAELRAGLDDRGLAGRVGIALATRPATLSRPALDDLAAAGVDTILIGVETLDLAALQATFTKRHGRLGLTELARHADGNGIALVASYILWHPWQTLDGLARELDEILAFGRHRVPQFLARSVLRVQPGTPVEQRLAAEGRLISGPFRRDFTFADPRVADVFSALSSWYDENVAPALRRVHEDQPGAFEAVGRLKLAEMDVLSRLLATATAA